MLRLVGSSRQGSADDLVRGRVTLGDEPEAAAMTVVPPLPVDARHVVAEVQGGRQLAGRRRLLRPAGDLAGTAELLTLARSTVGTGKQEGHLSVIAPGATVLPFWRVRNWEPA